MQIYDVGHAPEGLYYVSELVDGESLAGACCAGPLPPWQACAIAGQLVPGARPRARPADRSPRRQAGQHPALRRGTGQGRRLRRRPTGRGHHRRRCGDDRRHAPATWPPSRAAGARRPPPPTSTASASFSTRCSPAARRSPAGRSSSWPSATCRTRRHRCRPSCRTRSSRSCTAPVQGSGAALRRRRRDGGRAPAGPPRGRRALPAAGDRPGAHARPYAARRRPGRRWNDRDRDRAPRAPLGLAPAPRGLAPAPRGLPIAPRELAVAPRGLAAAPPGGRRNAAGPTRAVSAAQRQPAGAPAGASPPSSPLCSC